MYLTENEDFNYLEDKEQLLWNEELIYGNWTDGPHKDGSRQKTFSVLVPESVQQNGTWYLHVFIAKMGYTLDSDDKKYKEQAITYQSMCKLSGCQTKILKLRDMVSFLIKIFNLSNQEGGGGGSTVDKRRGECGFGSSRCG